MQAIVDNLKRENEALKVENAELHNELKRLSEQLAWFQRQVFGQKSERFTDLPGQTNLLPGMEMPEAHEPPAEPVAVPAHTRKKTRNKGESTVVIPDNLERVERIIDVPEAERILHDGTPMVRAGEDRSEKLAFRPSEYYVLVTVRPKYVAPDHPELGVLQEPMPGTLIEGSKFDTSFMAHVVEEKFAFHMPLYRIEEKLAGREIRVKRQTLSQLVRTIGERVQPLFKLMIACVLRQGYLFTDDTPVKLQCKGKCREARVWVYVGALPNAPPYHIYQFTEDRGHRHPDAFLESFEGLIHADAFALYEKLHADPHKPIRWAACWAHARRKFENALCGQEDLRTWVLRHMRYLFMYERVAWARDAAERLRIRQEREAPIVEEIFSRLRETIAAGDLLPKSKMAEAIGYVLSREENFTLYLSDPNVRMENNTAERSLRKLTIGRKNWLFVGSPKAGDSMAALLSLVQTCRAMDIRPWEYLTDIFDRLLDHPDRRLEELLPDRWKAAREDHQADMA
jgi:transposase